MQWLERMRQAMDYIEEHMTVQIVTSEIAKRAQCSEFHFQRMFSSITNVSLSEYIRRRRMTLAAQDIQQQNIKIIDLAMKYGYESPDAFSRAFQKLHGMTPTAARERGVSLKAYPRLSFYLILKGEEEMDYQIVDREGLTLIGQTRQIEMANTQSAVPAFWSQFCENGSKDRLRETAGYGPENESGARLLTGVIYDYQPDGASFRYMIAAERSESLSDEEKKEWEVLEIPSSTWVVFSKQCNSMQELDDIQGLWKRVPEFFQATDYQHAGLPELEEYHAGSDGYVSQVWIPIIK